METINLENIQNSRVFLRADMDVTFVNGNIESDFRIKRCLPTIELLLQKNNKVVIFTKIGRPEKQEPELSTKNLIPTLNRLLKTDIDFIENLKDLASRTFQLSIFENTRFFAWESSTASDQGKVLPIFSSLFDYYVDEAFAMSHRKETTNFLFPKLLKKISIGLNYKNEITHLEKIKAGEFEHPAVFVLGGIKAETKVPMINYLLDNFDMFLIGGKLDEEKIVTKDNSKLLIAKNNETGFDITDNSLKEFIEKIKEAKTIIWNGPTGMFEKEEHAESTREIIKAIEERKDTLNIAGGGDTIAAIEKYGNFNNYSFVSTGGGAMFHYLSGGLTNIEELVDSSR